MSHPIIMIYVCNECDRPHVDGCDLGGKRNYCAFCFGLERTQKGCPFCDVIIPEIVGVDTTNCKTRPRGTSTTTTKGPFGF